MNETIAQVYHLLEPVMDGTDMYLVNAYVNPSNDIKVFIDSDSGFSIEKAVLVNRKLYAAIESAGLFPAGDFSLEVSSPGVDEPLLQFRQYVKNKGRKVTVFLNDNTEKTGILKEIEPEMITLEITEGKQKTLTNIGIPFADIKKTIVQIIF